MKLNDAFFGAVPAALGVACSGTCRAFPAIPGQQFGPARFPGLIAAGLAVAGTLLVLSGLRRRDGAVWVRLAEWTGSARHVRALTVIVLGVVAYILWADALGFLLLAPLVLAAWLWALGLRPLPAAALAIVASLVIWYAFYKLLRVPLPWGVLTRYAF
ncbi:MAG: tripartite tricarboxylate transporter TctB family protein [Betaproteobacteria bacterium]|nr:tripartite tricarboxylate transporter TctB family protein [Betaproteobacteria bacterium]